MSCNGCRVLRKGCSDTCILRRCLQWIETPESQGHATVFVAKFFGRAGLMSFISNVPESQRPGLFKSLLFEAAGRTVNPVNGAVGLLWTGKWHLCEAAVETVLRGGALRPIPNVSCNSSTASPNLDDMFMLRKRNKQIGEYGHHEDNDASLVAKRMREETPSRNSEEESGTTTCFASGFRLGDHYFCSNYYNTNTNNSTSTLGVVGGSGLFGAGGEPKLFNFF